MTREITLTVECATDVTDSNRGIYVTGVYDSDYQMSDA